ncbi:MAG TPA: hypothetical protein VFI87_03360 [Hyphomicrobiaceae bacterium]|nr:hypothetical protein [Hyphomicrobiaceae bacterium]
MGNYSELYFAGKKAPPKRGELSNDSPYLLSKYHVPLLWLALFDPKDIVDIPVDGGEDVNPYLVKARDEAVVMLTSREPWLLSNFKNLKSLWVSQFKAVLEGADFDYVHLDTSDIGSMVGSGEEWKSLLGKILRMFSEQVPQEASPGLFGRLFAKPKEQTSWDVFNQRLGSAFNGDRGAQPWPYCGASGTDETMPWECDL